LATRLIKKELPRAMVVILTVSDDAADLFGAIRSGAQGYLLNSVL
jgi:DNA-binding NarL/FixJ family response regulator